MAYQLLPENVRYVSKALVMGIGTLLMVDEGSPESIVTLVASEPYSVWLAAKLWDGETARTCN
jgi:hypothetical protein